MSYKKIFGILSLCAFCWICILFHLPEKGSHIYSPMTMLTYMDICSRCSCHSVERRESKSSVCLVFCCLLLQCSCVNLSSNVFAPGSPSGCVAALQRLGSRCFLLCSRLSFVGHLSPHNMNSQKSWNSLLLNVVKLQSTFLSEEKVPPKSSCDLGWVRQKSRCRSFTLHQKTTLGFPGNAIM